MASKAFAVIAEFKDPKELLKAAEKVRDAGYKEFDTYSPFPIHGMDRAMGLGQSKLGWIVLVGGAFGLVAGMGLQGWVSTTAYPLIISGKPLFSYQAFIPVTFELMILFAAFATVFGMFALNKLPEFYNAIFKYSHLKKATSHGFFLSIEAKDPLYDTAKAKKLLKDLGGDNIEAIDED